MWSPPGLQTTTQHGGRKHAQAPITATHRVSRHMDQPQRAFRHDKTGRVFALPATYPCSRPQPTHVVMCPGERGSLEPPRPERKPPPAENMPRGKGETARSGQGGRGRAQDPGRRAQKGCGSGEWRHALGGLSVKRLSPRQNHKPPVPLVCGCYEITGACGPKSTRTRSPARAEVAGGGAYRGGSGRRAVDGGGGWW